MPLPVTVPAHPYGDVFTALMWSESIMGNINYFIVQGADQASTATMPVPAAYFQRITGTTTIGSITTTAVVAGTPVRYYISNGLTMQHNASGTGNLRLSQQVDAILPAGCIIEFVYDGTNWQEVGRSVSTMTRFIKNSQTKVSNSVTETDLLAITIPANEMGTNRIIHAGGAGELIQNSGGANNVTNRIKLGATTLWDSGASSFGTGAQVMGWSFGFWIFENATTNSQQGFGWVHISAQTNATTGIGAALGTPKASGGIRFANSAVDTTAAVVLGYTAILGVANASFDQSIDNAVVEVY